MAAIKTGKYFVLKNVLIILVFANILKLFFIIVYECLMCLKTFDSSSEKDDHILDHFAQEMCSDCNQILFRIGGKVFSLHNTESCTKKTATVENQIELNVSDEFNLNSGNDIENYLISSCATSEVVSIEEVQIKSEIIEQIEEEIENIEANELFESDDGSDYEFQSDVTKEKSLCPLNDTIKNDGKFKCDECGKILGRKDSLQRHKILLHGASGGFFCNICIKVFSTAQELAEHKKLCTWKRNNGDKIICGQFECDICGTKLKNKSILRGHMRWKHNPSAKQFKCVRCESTFLRKSLLEIHYNRKHLDIREYVCSECGRKFKTKDQLKSHSYLHSGEKPIKCLFDNCDKGFRSRANREQHMRTHSMEKPFYCSVNGCKQHFKQRSALKQHIINVHGTHSIKFSCQICDKSFSRKSRMKAHEIRAHDVQPQ